MSSDSEMRALAGCRPVFLGERRGSLESRHLMAWPAVKQMLQAMPALSRAQRRSNGWRDVMHLTEQGGSSCVRAPVSQGKTCMSCLASGMLMRSSCLQVTARSACFRFYLGNPTRSHVSVHQIPSLQVLTGVKGTSSPLCAHTSPRKSKYSPLPPPYLPYCFAHQPYPCICIKLFCQLS